MRCGNKNCKNDRHHDTVAEVRACYGLPQASSFNVPGPHRSAGRARPSTWPEETTQPATGWAATTTPPTSALPKIHEPKTEPVLAGSAEDVEEQLRSGRSFIAEIPSVSDWAKFKRIPAGYYATPSLTGNNDLDFWKVQEGKGRWDGYKFIKRVIGGRDDADIPRDSKKRVKTQDLRDRVTQAKAFQAILDYGIKDSNRLFGTELKYCRECGIHLTDETSRALGIGPICRG